MTRGMIRRVQVLYYVLLQTGHLDVYVGNREAAPARADRCRQNKTVDKVSCVASPLLSTVNLFPLGI